MMRRAVCRILLGTAAALALAIPAVASAGTFPLPNGTPPQVRALVESRIETGQPDPRRSLLTHRILLEGSHGYSALVTAEGNSVLIQFSREKDHTLTAYAVKGKVTRDLVRADFGAFGSISMRFHPSRRPGATSRDDFCHGVPEKIERHGTYDGSIRFDGENGFSAVAAHHAKGNLEAIHSSTCESDDFLFLSANSSKDEPVKRPRLLFAGWREGGTSVEFGALTLHDKTRVIALTEKSEGRIGIFHFASVSAPTKALVVNDALTGAKFSGRKPFGGEAVYTAAPDGSTSWEGSLSVDFPGARDFPLAGPQFDVEVDAGF